jgi:hypothetical protein
MTQRRDWPNWAAEARNRSAEEAAQGVRLLAPLVDGVQFDRTETLRRQAQALRNFQTILRFLESVGARTRPE